MSRIAKDVEKLLDRMGLQPSENEPGLAVSIWRVGEPAHVVCRGYARRGGTPITPWTVFDLASVSKMFTALCVAIVTREHHVALDTLLGDILPEMRAAAPGVRLQHLLYHTSGLPDYMELFEAKGLGLGDRLGMGETLGILAEAAPVGVPGKKYSYSNTGYVLLSAIVERLSGSSMAAFARRHVFAPLSMERTNVIDRMPAQVEDAAQSYDTEGLDVNPLWDMTGDGQVYSCLEDLGLWVNELITPALFPDVLPQLREPGTLDDGTALQYGAGLQLEQQDGHPIFGHDGGWGGFSSSLLVSPFRKTAVIILANRADIEAGFLARTCLKLLIPSDPSDGSVRATSGTACWE